MWVGALQGISLCIANAAEMVTKMLGIEMAQHTSAGTEHQVDMCIEPHFSFAFSCMWPFEPKRHLQHVTGKRRATSGASQRRSLSRMSRRCAAWSRTSRNVLLAWAGRGQYVTVMSRVRAQHVNCLEVPAGVAGNGPFGGLHVGGWERAGGGQT